MKLCIRETDRWRRKAQADADADADGGGVQATKPGFGGAHTNASTNSRESQVSVYQGVWNVSFFVFSCPKKYVKAPVFVVLTYCCISIFDV